MRIMTNIGWEAIRFIKQNKRFLIEHFIPKDNFVGYFDAQPVSIFMAGSPGAGKTEFSKRLLKENNIHAVRIDADEIKEIIPQYTKVNSHQIQGASALGVEYLHDYVLKKNLSMLLDGTFADYKKSRMNIIRSLHKGRYVEIFYIYQNPKIAWRFTQAREATEGRRIPKKFFIQSLLRSHQNVKKVKIEFGNRIKIHAIVKNYKKNMEVEYPDINNLDELVKIPYTQKALMGMI